MIKLEINKNEFKTHRQQKKKKNGNKYEFIYLYI